MVAQRRSQSVLMLHFCKDIQDQAQRSQIAHTGISVGAPKPPKRHNYKALKAPSKALKAPKAPSQAPKAPSKAPKAPSKAPKAPKAPSKAPPTLIPLWERCDHQSSRDRNIDGSPSGRSGKTEINPEMGWKRNSSDVDVVVQ